MEYSGPFGHSLSPESTVTSLLSSSGYLRSSLLPPQHDTSFRYKDREYDSASAALDAYIKDFEKSRQNRDSSLTGKLVLPQSLPSTPCRHRVGTLRNKDVLRERLTERELDFLNLPVSPLHHRVNWDRHSMTTNELLSVPFDGSMPVTHTTAFIQGFYTYLLSWPATSQPCPSSTCRLLHHHSLPPTTSRSSRFELLPFSVINTVASPFQRSEQAPASSSLHLPHWFTSNKADLDCSGITSVPDLKYPAWLQGCDLSEPPAQSDLWDDHGSFLDYICTNLPRCHSISSSFNRFVVCNIPLLFVLSQDLSHENSIWKQPGPVEALKQMLFRLQAVEAELQRQQQPPAALTLSEWLLTSATQVQGARQA
uniref:Lung adenoma susceptibility protein 2 n=1 Tax=Neolamprologus brichardi TaxID=32507 RepID=A0A3Q4GE07_NEOBR